MPPVTDEEYVQRQLAAGRALYAAAIRFLGRATYDGEPPDLDRPSAWAKGEFTREGARELAGALIKFRAAERSIEL